MDYRAECYTRALKGHDKELLCKKDPWGVFKVYRKGVRWDAFSLEGNTLRYAVPVELYVLSLTDDWSSTGNPREWGVEPLISKIKESDFTRDGIYLVDKLRRERELLAESKDRAMRSEIGAIAGELRKDFAKATNDIVLPAGRSVR